MLVHLFKDLLDKTKSSDNTKSWAKNYKQNEIEFYLVYFNTTTKTVINSKFDKSWSIFSRSLVQNW